MFLVACELFDGIDLPGREKNDGNGKRHYWSPRANKWNPKKRQVNKKAKKERKKQTNNQCKKFCSTGCLKRPQVFFCHQSWPKVLKFLNLNDVCCGFGGTNSPKKHHHMLGEFPTGRELVPYNLPRLTIPFPCMEHTKGVPPPKYEYERISFINR